jgi:hypothetical protein
MLSEKDKFVKLPRSKPKKGVKNTNVRRRKD